MKSTVKTDPAVLFKEVPVSPEVLVSVVIPVKNEADCIAECLSAFLIQTDTEGQKIDEKTFELLILVNNCTDESAAIIEKFIEKNPNVNVFPEEIILEREQANIGFVRKTLMDIAYSRLNKNGGGIIMTTDADTIVSQDWICQNIREITEGADAVGGRILFKEDDLNNLDSNTLLFHEEDEKYQLLVAEFETHMLENFDCNKTGHHQHFNGSFAVTTGCYEKAGGIPEVTHLEDCAFYEQLLRIDAKVRHSTDVKVKTSARYIGRTEIGLSNQLHLWSKIDPENKNFLVESFESLWTRFTLKKKLYDLWKRREKETLNLPEELERIDENMMISEDMISQFSLTTYFGEWFQCIKNQNEIKWREKFPSSPIEEAIKKLQHFLRDHSP